MLSTITPARKRIRKSRPAALSGRTAVLESALCPSGGSNLLSELILQTSPLHLVTTRPAGREWEGRMGDGQWNTEHAKRQPRPIESLARFMARRLVVNICNAPI